MSSIPDVLLDSLSELEEKNRQDNRALSMEKHSLSLLESELINKQSEKRKLSAEILDMEAASKKYQNDIIKCHEKTKDLSASLRFLQNHFQERSKCYELVNKEISKSEANWLRKIEEMKHILKLFGKDRYIEFFPELKAEKEQLETFEKSPNVDSEIQKCILEMASAIVEYRNGEEKTKAAEQHMLERDKVVCELNEKADAYAELYERLTE
eukprot:Nk52_evm28s745 gene=Nk52_evmTU28s745